MAWYKVLEKIESYANVHFDESRRECRNIRVIDCTLSPGPWTRPVFLTPMKLMPHDYLDPDTNPPSVMRAPLAPKEGPIESDDDKVFRPDFTPRNPMLSYYEDRIKPLVDARPCLPFSDKDVVTTRDFDEVGASIGFHLVNNLEDGKEAVADIRNLRWNYKPHVHGEGEAVEFEVCVSGTIRRVEKQEPLFDGLRLPNPFSQSTPYQESFMNTKFKSEALAGLNGQEPPKPAPKLEWKLETIYNRVDGQRLRLSFLVDGVEVDHDITRCKFTGDWSERYARKVERKIEAAKAGIMRTYLLTKRQSGPVA